jgi:hypothetical protein
MKFKKGDIVVCIKLDDVNHLTIGQKYEIYDSIEMNDMTVIQIIRLDGILNGVYFGSELLGFYSDNNFVKVEEYRNQKIQKIFDND